MTDEHDPTQVPGLILYSTNVFMKYFVAKNFYKDRHYVWCSDVFDSSTAPLYSSASLVPPSSDPCALFHRLKDDVKQRDSHSEKIVKQKSSLKARAVKREEDGTITREHKQEIVYYVDEADWSWWRPVIYLIPRGSIADARVKLVPHARRAGFGPEYIIEDLHGSEFDILDMTK